MVRLFYSRCVALLTTVCAFAPGTREFARSGLAGGVGPAANAAATLGGGGATFLGDGAAAVMHGALPVLTAAEMTTLRAGRAVQRCARAGRRGEGLVVVEVNANADTLLSLISDVERLPDIIPSIRSARVVDGPARGLLGASGRQVAPTRAVVELSKLRLQVPFAQRRFGLDAVGSAADRPDGGGVVAFTLDKGASAGMSGPRVADALGGLLPGPLDVLGGLARAPSAGLGLDLGLGAAGGAVASQCLDEAVGFWCVEPLAEAPAWSAGDADAAGAAEWSRVWLSVSAVVSALLPPSTVEYVAERALPRATKWLRQPQLLDSAVASSRAAAASAAARAPRLVR